MNNSLKRISERDSKKLSEEEYKKINESIIRKNPALGVITEKVIYDKNFLLEASNNGYDPLDAEDVQNFIEKKPPKNINRNILLCGADKYNNLGCSNEEELDLFRFQRKHNIDIVKKDDETTFLSDIPTKKLLKEITNNNTYSGEFDINEAYAKSRDHELSDNDIKEYYTNATRNIDDIHRKGLAKAFGSDEIELNMKEVEATTGMVKHDPSINKMLELIKELKALGFTPEEIKNEIKKL